MFSPQCPVPWSKKWPTKINTIYGTGILTIFRPHLWFELRIIDPAYQIVSIELIDYGKEKLNHWETFYTINPPLPLVLLLLSCYYLLRVHRRHLRTDLWIGTYGPANVKKSPFPEKKTKFWIDPNVRINKPQGSFNVTLFSDTRYIENSVWLYSHSIWCR